MFQTPIGGVSFLVNLSIIWMSMFVRKFKSGSTKRYLVTQAGISRIEEGTVGLVLSRTFVVVFPIFIFCVLSYLSVMVLHRLDQDERKISIVDAARWGGTKAYLGVAYVRDHRVVANLPFTRNSPQNAILLASASSSEIATSSVDVSQLAIVEDSSTSSPSISDEAFTDEFVFLNGRELTALTPFLDANEIGSTFSERKEIATYFGIPLYRGTKEQNEKLLQILKELTSKSLEDYTNSPLQ